MNRIALLLTGVFGVLSGNLTAQDAVLELHQKKFDWMINLQLDSLEFLLEEEMLYIHSNGWIETKEEVIGNLKSGHLAYKEVDIKKQKVRYFDNTAIVTGEAEFHVALDGRPITIELLYTEVYQRIGDQWLFIHRHSNRNTVSD